MIQKGTSDHLPPIQYVIDYYHSSIRNRSIPVSMLQAGQGQVPLEPTVHAGNSMARGRYCIG